jgi:hypothetical protein
MRVINKNLKIACVIMGLSIFSSHRCNQHYSFLRSVNHTTPFFSFSFAKLMTD